MDLNKIKEYAKGYEKDMTAFLRAIVKNPGESCDEKAHVETIAAEMKKVGFDEVVIDPQGNVMGFMGTGDKIIAFDAHIDTVGIGNIDNWKFDPMWRYRIWCIRSKDHERSRTHSRRIQSNGCWYSSGRRL